MVLPEDGLIPLLQPNLGYEQEEVISKLYSLSRNSNWSYIDWLRMYKLLNIEWQKARHIETNTRRNFFA